LNIVLLLTGMKIEDTAHNMNHATMDPFYLQNDSCLQLAQPLTRDIALPGMITAHSPTHLPID
jgi:hypothetical protein